MAKHIFTVKEALLFGWHTFKKNWQFLIRAFLIIIVIGMVPNWLNKLATANNLPTVSFLLVIIEYIVQMITGIGVIIISLKLVDGKKPELSDIYKHLDLLLNYFLGSILYLLLFIVQFALILIGTITNSVPLATLGFLLLIYPGIFFGIKYQYTVYLIVDRRMRIWDAFKKSGQLTQGVKLKLIILGLGCAAITLVGILLIGIGLLIAWPVIALSSAYVYRKLSPKI